MCIQIKIHNNVQHKLLFSTNKPSTLIKQSIMDKHGIIKVWVPLNKGGANEFRTGVFLLVYSRFNSKFDDRPLTF